MMRVPTPLKYVEERKEEKKKMRDIEKPMRRSRFMRKHIVDHCLRAETLNEPFQCLQAMCIDRCQLQFNEKFILIFFEKKKRRTTWNSSSIRSTISITSISDGRFMHTLTHIGVSVSVVSNETCKNYYLLKLMLANKREEERVCEQQDLNVSLFRMSFSHLLRRFNFVYMWCGMHFH